MRGTFNGKLWRDARPNKVEEKIRQLSAKGNLEQATLLAESYRVGVLKTNKRRLAIGLGSKSEPTRSISLIQLDAKWHFTK